MDFNTLIEPLVVTSALFGLAPYARSRSASGVRYRKSRTALIVSALWLAAMLALMLLSVPVVADQKGTPHSSWVIYVSNVLQGVCGYLLFIYTHAVAVLTRDQKLTMFATFSELGVVLGESLASYRRYRRLLVVQLLVYLVCVGAANAGLLAGAFSGTTVLRMAILFVASMSNTLAETHYTNSLAMLRQLFVRFNDKLEEIETHDRWDFGVDIPSEIGLVQQCWLHPWQKRHRCVLADDNDRGAFLRHHETLFQLAKDVNSMYGVQNVLTVSQIFLYLLNMLYAIVDSTIHSSSGVLRGALAYNVVLQLVRIIIPVSLSCSVSLQAERCAFEVSKLQMTAKSARVRKQMGEFSVQLLHRPMKFSACSLFPLDGTLIFAIVGGVTSYLVILIQFQCVN